MTFSEKGTKITSQTHIQKFEIFKILRSQETLIRDPLSQGMIPLIIVVYYKVFRSTQACIYKHVTFSEVGTKITSQTHIQKFEIF